MRQERFISRWHQIRIWRRIFRTDYYRWRGRSPGNSNKICIF